MRSLFHVSLCWILFFTSYESWLSIGTLSPCVEHINWLTGGPQGREILTFHMEAPFPQTKAPMVFLRWFFSLSKNESDTLLLETVCPGCRNCEKRQGECHTSCHCFKVSQFSLNPNFCVKPHIHSLFCLCPWIWKIRYSFFFFSLFFFSGKTHSWGRWLAGTEGGQSEG